MKKQVLSPEKIMEQALKRLRDDGFQKRNQAYENYLSYYEGKQKRSGVHSVEAMDSKGRAMLRDVGGSLNMNRTITANRIAPAVDDFQALLGRWPTVRVPPPMPSDKDEVHDVEGAERKAQKETRLLQSSFELARVHQQQAQAGFQLSCMGDTVYVLEPDWPHKRILPAVVDPRFCFPRFMSGWRRFELYDLVIAYTLNKDEVKIEYEVDPGDDKGDQVLVVTYLSPYQRTVVVGERSLAEAHHAEWDFDFCPAEWVHNKVTQNNRYGTSDVAQILSLQDYYNFILNVLADGLVEMTYPIRAIINPMRFGQDQITVGPGEAIALEEGGDIKVVAPTPPPTAGNMLMDHVIQDMMAGSGSSITRQTGEQPHSSIATGRGLHAAQGPQATRIELRQIQLGAAITRLCSRMLELQEKAPGFKEHMESKGLEVHGRFQGKSFREVIKAEDIDGWYEVTVSFDQLVGVSDQQKLFIAMQGMAAELGDDLWAREQLGIEDPQGMRDRVEGMKLHKARTESQMQQLLAGGGQPQSGGPGGQPQGGQPPGGPQGGPPQGGPPGPAPIMRPPGMAQASPVGGAPKGVTLGALKGILANAADRIHGTVWALADLALQGQSQNPQLAVSDYRDASTVTEVVRPLAPQVKVKAIAEKDLPTLKERVA